MVGSSCTPGQLHLVVGPMFAGKSTELIRRIRRHSAAKQRCIIIRSGKDTRSEASSTSTHDKVSMPALSVMRLGDAEDALDDYDVIGIDEGQFFPDLVEFCCRMVDRGKVIIVAALDGTYQQEAFGQTLELVPKAESVQKLVAVCYSCGADAPFSKRIVQSDQLELIGGAESYVASCRACLA